MTTEGAWIGYSGTARIGLAVVLLAAAAGVAYAGTRWPGPAAARRPRPAVANLMLAIWILAITAFLVCASVYVHQARHEFPGRATPADPITPVTAAFGFPRHPHSQHGRSGGQARERRDRRPGRTLDLRAAVRSHHRDPDLSGPSRSGRVPGAVLRAAVRHRAQHAGAPDAVPHGETVQGDLLVLRADAGGVRRLGPGRVRLPVRSHPHHAECGVEDPRLRHGAHPVPAPAAPGGRGRPQAGAAQVLR